MSIWKSLQQGIWCKRLKASLIACVLSVFCLNPVWADDTEIYFNSGGGFGAKPNLLFVLDASYSMNWFDCADGRILNEHIPCNDGTENGDNSRLERLVAAMEEVLVTLPDNLNVGLMRFGGYDGGRIIYPMSDLAEPGVRAALDRTVKEIVAVVGTPSVGALEETWRYYSGLPVNHGKVRADTTRANSMRHSRVSHPDSYTGGTRTGVSAACLDSDLNSIACENERIVGNPVYKSPIVSECQANYAILLSDGAPWVGDVRNVVPAYQETLDTIEGLIGGACVTDDNSRHEFCGEEMARFMNQNDLSSLPGLQNIVTHTIGFNNTNDWFLDVAREGGGNFFPAESSADLINVISDIGTQVSDSGATVVAPAVAIDQFTRLSHRKETYLALFKPKASEKWVGNLKRFDLSGSPPTLKDQEGNDAINAATGEFFPSSRSFWSATADGAEVVDGGAASHLDPASRRMVSYLDIDDKDLLSAENRISIDNDLLTAPMLGASGAGERDLFIDWLSGIDVKDEDEDSDISDLRNHIGDPLHSSPVVVTYGSEAGRPVDADNPNSVVYFGTNEGFLHAINTADGTEDFAFMPQELMPNVADLFADRPIGRDGGRVYGLDGNIVVRTKDINGNGEIEAADGDKAYLYVGMRRGGRNYYALDVSEKGQPKFLWSINGGTGDYAELGQSWSMPMSTQVKIDDEVKDILVFSGGYDAEQDDKVLRAPDSVGRAIFFVDADTGELIWSGGNPENQPAFSSKHYTIANMDYSIPADLALVPDSSTGYLSQMYVGDMGGRLWRFDIDNGESIADLVDGGIIADFSKDSSIAETRRFYGSPDLSLTRADGNLVINIAIGSGYRAHPLNMQVEDKFILYRYPFAGHGDEYGVARTATNYTPATLLDLFDTTDNIIGEGSAVEMARARDELADKQGWFISMEGAGEKVIDRSSTFEEVVRFVSYEPIDSLDPCAPAIGKSFFYAVNLQDGSPFEGFAEDPTSGRSLRKKESPTPGIVPPISTIFVENDGVVTPTDISGVNTVYEWENVNLLRRWFWAENPQ